MSANETRPQETPDEIAAALRRCRSCRDLPEAVRLPHEPRPIFQLSSTASLFVCSQAPGIRAHVSGTPFNDPSGVRLRAWMGISSEDFYDSGKVGIVPMGFCFPGYDKNKGDLPPRRECAALWRTRIFDSLATQPQLILLVGGYAQRWHLGDRWKPSLTETLKDWRTLAASESKPSYLPLPHPSWRNNGWLKRNPWFEEEILPYLRSKVKHLLYG